MLTKADDTKIKINTQVTLATGAVYITHYTKNWHVAYTGEGYGLTAHKYQS